MIVVTGVDSDIEQQDGAVDLEANDQPPAYSRAPPEITFARFTSCFRVHTWPSTYRFVDNGYYFGLGCWLYVCVLGYSR
jgi:hypothetical protein